MIPARTTLAPAVAVIAALVLSGCVAGTSASPSGDEVLPESVVAPLIEQLPERSGETPDLARLAEGLTPPTNRWFSGLVFGPEPLPVFPLPLSFGLTPTGFQFGLPTVTTNPGAITAPFTPQVSVDTGSDTSVVTAYDEVAVTTSLSRAEEPLSRVTIARGSPVVSYVADDAHDIRSSVPLTDAGDGLYTATVGDVEFGLVTPNGSLGGDSTTVSLPEGAQANWFVVPDGGDVVALAALAADPIESVTTAFDGTTTRLDYRTADGGDTLFGALPHQLAGLEGDCDLGTYATVYGAMQLCSGTRLALSVDAVEPAGALDLSSLDGAKRDELVTQLRADVAAAREIRPDTYFGGKDVARLATLLQLARELGADEEAAAITESLTAELRLWTDPAGCDERAERCFTYDPELHGVVGLAASFGSDQFNDHHFHYGYFLFAAAVLAEGDAELTAELKPVMTLLAADIASGKTSGAFPALRAFDPYSGHSWASGFSPFADGNNQESSSEAVAAWNGLALWAKVADDAALESQARWMLAAEANSALAYWIDFDQQAEPFVGYDRGVVGIVWDGKRDYGTWFDASPAAILGIQLLPMDPVAEYLATDPDRIRANIAEATAAGPAPIFADQLIMYGALAGPDDAAAALEQARVLPDSGIDDGNSRTYLLAWIMAHGG